MSRDDGFAIADTDTGMMSDAKVLALARLLRDPIRTGAATRWAALAEAQGELIEAQLASAPPADVNRLAHGVAERREVADGAGAAEARARDHVVALTAEAERQALAAAIEVADQELEGNAERYWARYALLEVGVAQVQDALDVLGECRATDARLGQQRAKLDGSDAGEHQRLPVYGIGTPSAVFSPFGPNVEGFLAVHRPSIKG
jgi:hypothetical protein